MTDTENITLSKILVLDLLRRAAPSAYLAEREELLRTIILLRQSMIDHNKERKIPWMNLYSL